jgi:2-polyprenyl-6-methoxyphenol hydroxylase-like FAD-dependent oxidoreductase
MVSMATNFDRPARIPDKAPMTSVIVVGAGPTGLLLAGDLAEAGLRVALLERRHAGLSNLSRAFGVHARTMEMLDMRGLADAVLAHSPYKMDKIAAFGNAELDLSGLPTRFPYLLLCPQTRIEEVLLSRAERAGVELRHDTEVTGLDQRPGGVTVIATDPAGQETRVEAEFLVGCDGVRSTVRDLVGLSYPGGPVLRSIMLGDVKLSDPPERPIVHTNRHGFGFLAPFGDGYWRITAWSRDDQADDSAELSLEQIAAATRQAFGTDYGMHSPRWISRFHSDERQVASYRVGRVFLAGDAAHCHTPAGGQGMNTGMQDAANLSWRLAAVAHGAAAELLDGYHAERRPIGAEVLRSSGRMARIATVRSRSGVALRDAIAPLILGSATLTRKATMQISGLGINYGRRSGEPAVVGTRVPDIDLVDGGRLYEHLRGGRFALLGGPVLQAWKDRAAFLPGSVSQTDAVLVRPDGYAAWSGRPDRDDVAEALRRWCSSDSMLG